MSNEGQEISVRQKLEKRRTELQQQIDFCRDELQKVEYALKMFDDPSATVNHGVELQLTEAGSLKNVYETLVEFLSKHGSVAAASEMAEALYTFRLSITVSQLKRRFSVATSAMYKNYDHPLLIDSGLKNRNREILWALPDWMEDDELKEKYKPENLKK